YLFIPVFGPTTVRDGTGWVVRAYTSPIGYISDVPLRNVLIGIGAVDLRASALQAESLVNQAAIDRYTFIRRAYLQRRRYLVYDGQPPPLKEDDE
ncbi:MAG TPA: MlaA family lipoprotein, partial [Casimicrobiaceae bacterium]|nr:MlaA family lipoprotein [Casimicrobiaceae bacterium]